MTGSSGRPASGDPVDALLTLLPELEPVLSSEVVLEALGQAAARPDGRRRIARAVVDRPGLLTGQGARAEFPGVLRFISALVKAGAVAVVEPPCPRCGRRKQLSALVDGLRLCAGCVRKARALRCGRCGAVRSPARRNDNGQPICQNCWRRDPRIYAQKLSVIAALTTQHVLHEDGRTLLRLGSRPIVLPAPLDALVGALAGGRKIPGTSLLSVPSSWLFPGRRPGSPLTEDALGQRLHALGISPRHGRGTALFTLAADVPAAILAKTPGIRVKAAIQWQKISGGDWSTYAADVSRRSHAQERARAGDQRADPLPSA